MSYIHAMPTFLVLSSFYRTYGGHLPSTVRADLYLPIIFVTETWNE